MNNIPNAAHAGTGKTGVLLINLGTPDEATPKAVKRYLLEFLSDRRVVGIPPIIWQPILRGIILNTRPKKSAAAYQKVWTERGSPLSFHTQDQAENLQQRLGDEITVDWAMRYGNPSIPDRLTAMQNSGSERIILAPLYPQFSDTTTTSVADKVEQSLAKMARPPELRSMAAYFDDPVYIDALANDISGQLDRLNFAPETLLLSFHGLPQRNVDLGDPYQEQCLKTAMLLEKAIKRGGLKIRTSFQSRFGAAKWIEPATDTTLAEEAASGTKRLAIVAPGFSVDCLETLEELAIAGKEQFFEAGGEQFATLSCLNAGQSGMDMLETLIRQEMSDRD